MLNDLFTQFEETFVRLVFRLDNCGSRYVKFARSLPLGFARSLPELFCKRTQLCFGHNFATAHWLHDMPDATICATFFLRM
jgi:hypothetical protein